ncbi:MAG: transcription elongation factor GreA [Rothia sp. (in: high G+C Gram-positive bacteria)]|nr:transcription elongation factor GreA [Rothia sp. (in: high G+C Gram-positive bacteria)]
MTSENKGAWLTQEAYDRLSKELEYLSGPYRQEIVDRIAAARDEGDLKENGGYHAAREEQGKNEGRIAQLKSLLDNAYIGEAVKDDGIVEPGMVVDAEIAGKAMKFLLGSREVADSLVGDSQLQVFSEKSPMGAAINGHKVGEEVSYQAPNGQSITVKITAAEPFSG